MARGFGTTELIIIEVLRSNIGMECEPKPNEGEGYKFTFKKICAACKDRLTKEQVHSALGRLVRRGTVWKTNKIRPQKYWVLLVTTRRIH